MRLMLILPSSRKSNPNLARWKQPKAHRYPGLGIITVAALCPPHIEVRLIDDEYETIPWEDPTDLVAVSSLTVAARRAYEISRNFRARNIPVVLGGMHVTACPGEALENADAVVVGEAEDTWPELLEDFQNGRLKKLYQSSNRADPSQTPIPRRDLLDRRRYTTINTVQATRGCPFQCEFCAIVSLFGSKTRFRPIEMVIEEIRSLDGHTFLLNDDNIGQAGGYFKELFRRLIPLRKRWVGESSWNIVTDDETLVLLERSGCRGLAIGFESLEPQHGVKKIRPHIDTRRLYQEVVEKLHRHKISVMGNFIFGFDNDDETVFARTLQFALESQIDIAQFSILTPLPGTPLHKRLQEEGRITERDWNYYSGNNLCFQIKNMSADTFLQKFDWVKREFNSYPKIIRRVARGVRRGLSPYELGLLLGINLGYKKNMTRYRSERSDH